MHRSARVRDIIVDKHDPSAVFKLVPYDFVFDGYDKPGRIHFRLADIQDGNIRVKSLFGFCGFFGVEANMRINGTVFLLKKPLSITARTGLPEADWENTPGVVFNVLTYFRLPENTV
jgi:hypothetical protein